MHGRRALTIGLSGLLLAAGCKGGGGAADGGGEMTIVVSSDAHLKKKEAQLATQRQHLEGERSRLLAEREQLIAKIQGGTDARTLVKLQQTLLAREKRLAAEQDALDQQRAEVSKQRDALLGQAGAAKADPQASIAAREAAVARREADVSAREKDVAEREKAVARREARLAVREQALAVEQSLPPLVAPGGGGGGGATRAQVEQAHRTFRQLMVQRGILPGDLPPDVAAMERRFYVLSRKGRWSEALDTAHDLTSAVKGIQVNEHFIQAKMARLNALRAGRKLSGTQGHEVEGLLAKATSAFADGRQSDANLQLNRMFAILGK